ncbi:TetR/AcrR family transcriptional regulator [Hydrogenophaga sp. PBL-H3]|uniref:TetR/AcrR family transcriptional regulator n=1 Tax=Hydrogenophaga sp. PBL-H3 TaxID=434010 RepID=UPI00131F919E|nr:TetR/AcrR family transcriptional regulator [Hydrogenophaga sp. PBL-H3]QHE78047.1 TetR/AcrR family transcriptional regulator [Hydrogenophaga sp. PBL-H3]QHE82472.1 TetR/AcrR family transcriptional regulator [Hydrogenophaga sp. PBL-H3]
MDIAPSRKALTHERILDTAARAIRRAGFQGVGVADIMKEAGLTHGGFYAHFASRDALLAEALEHAGQQSASRIAKGNATRQARGASPFKALIEGYLSDSHLSGTENGCAVAALASEMPRQAPDVRAAAAQRVRSLMALVERSLPAPAGPGNAAAIASQMVGALQLARALGDNAEGRALLAANRSALLAQHDASPRD